MVPIIVLAGQAPPRRSRLSSNVRRRQNPLRVLAGGRRAHNLWHRYSEQARILDIAPCFRSEGIAGATPVPHSKGSIYEQRRRWRWWRQVWRQRRWWGQQEWRQRRRRLAQSHRQSIGRWPHECTAIKSEQVGSGSGAPFHKGGLARHSAVRRASCRYRLSQGRKHDA